MLRVICTNDIAARADMLSGNLLRECPAGEHEFHILSHIDRDAGGPNVVTDLVDCLSGHRLVGREGGSARLLPRGSAGEDWLEVFALVLDVHFGEGESDRHAGLIHAGDLISHFDGEVRRGERARLPWRHILLVTQYAAHQGLIEEELPLVRDKAARLGIPKENVLPYPSRSDTARTSYARNRLRELARVEG